MASDEEIGSHQAAGLGVQSEAQVFTYTAQSGAHISAVFMFAFLLVIEGSVLVLLIIGLVPDPTLKLALLALLAAFYLFFIVLLLSPRFTRHRLDATHLHLRYGFYLHADLPRTAILSARPLTKTQNLLESLGARYEADKQRITASLSDRGQVLIQLDEARPLRAGMGKPQPTSELLINVDDRERFLSALNLPERAEKPAAPVAARVAEPVSPSRPPVVASSGGPAAIRTEGLVRRYGDFTAVHQLDLVIRRGEVYGFLGPNGAGKTTTIKMLVGLLIPNRGRVLIDGHDLSREPLLAKAAFGYVADHAILYERLSGREFLEFLAQMRGIPPSNAEERIRRLLEMLELSDRADALTGSYSLGMKRKLALAGALLHEPPILILDEPLSGLDPRSARVVKDLLADLAARGSTVFLSTHDLATAEAVCHRVGILNQGRLIAEGPVGELRSQLAAPDLESVFLLLTAGANA